MAEWISQNLGTIVVTIILVAAVAGIIYKMIKDKEGIALYRMAKLYDEMGEKDKAAVCFEKNLTKN